MALPTNQQVKRAMIDYARKQKPPIKVGPGINAGNNKWGPAARTLAWRITRRVKDVKTTTRKTPELCRLVGFKVVPIIIEHDWKWARPLGKRAGDPPFIIVHNQAGTGTTAAIHAYHQSIGMVGIAYHYHITLEGEVHRGRPEWAMGGHTLYYNHCIGVCFEGNYDLRKSMPRAQREAGLALIADLKRRYGVPVKGHREMPLNSTSCPGKHFPLKEMR
jgi:hypothetical protein